MDDTDECARARNDLARAKDRVPEARQRMGLRRWNSIVNVPGPMERRNKDKKVINRAYHKMHEILLTCVLPRTTRSLHLCEAPGGFVQCVSEHLATREWTWLLATLPVADPAPSSCLPYDRGSVVLCDVFHGVPDAVDASFDLVTADGAVEMDHARLEESHRPLLVAQCRVAFRCLSTGGTFVVKLFEGLEQDTRRVIAWISNKFESTSILKPTSSRPTNSERYLVCRRFLGDVVPDERWKDAHTSRTWDLALQNVVTRLADAQSNALDCVTQTSTMTASVYSYAERSA